MDQGQLMTFWGVVCTLNYIEKESILLLCFCYVRTIFDELQEFYTECSGDYLYFLFLTADRESLQIINSLIEERPLDSNLRNQKSISVPNILLVLHRIKTHLDLICRFHQKKRSNQKIKYKQRIMNKNY